MIVELYKPTNFCIITNIAILLIKITIFFYASISTYLFSNVLYQHLLQCRQVSFLHQGLLHLNNILDRVIIRTAFLIDLILRFDLTEKLYQVKYVLLKIPFLYAVV